MKEFYRKTTEEELQFYQETLYPLQDVVFETAAVYEDKLYLTGGTALSRFYFHHRLSEDLDFFIMTDDLKLLVNDLSARLQNQGLVVEVAALEIYFARIYIVTESIRLKVEFAREFNMLGQLIKTKKNIFINSLDDIGANKITAFEDRAQIKDIIDLYYITREIPIEQLFILAERKRVPVAYENLLAVNTEGISGYALMLEDLNEHVLHDFAQHIQQRTEEEIKKKERVAYEHLEDVIGKLLWDFPYEKRTMNGYSAPVLKSRVHTLKLPERRALQKVLT